jgi:hypothetical protein
VLSSRASCLRVGSDRADTVWDLRCQVRSPLRHSSTAEATIAYGALPPVFEGAVLP